MAPRREYLNLVLFDRPSVVGTPEQVADVFAQWFTARACDGFTLHGGNSFDRFTGEVVPMLQGRGLLRREYEGENLRQNLGLKACHLALAPAVSS